MNNKRRNSGVNNKNMFDTVMAKGMLPSALCGFLELTIGGLIGEKDKYIYLRYVSKGEMQEDDYSITQ